MEGHESRSFDEGTIKALEHSPRVEHEYLKRAILLLG